MREAQWQLIEKHLDLVLEANKTTNLTHILDRQEGLLLHVEDSLVAMPEMQDAPDGPYADLGSGGGFPGFPLAIATGRNTTLVDSVKKKAALLESFAHSLNLDDSVSVFAGRAEELAIQAPEKFGVITARALTALPSLLELASPLLSQGGHLICYKAANVEEELESALPVQDKLAMHLYSQRIALLSDGVTARTIIVFEKKGTPSVKLPRRSGMAQKRPYTS